jgi:Fe-S oxidoreductase
MDFNIKTMAEYAAEGKSPEVLFWVGCAGSFDDRAKKITKAFCKILNKIGVEFAVLDRKKAVLEILQNVLETNLFSR